MEPTTHGLVGEIQKRGYIMKRFLAFWCILSLLLTAACVSTSALSATLEDSSWQDLELKALYYLSGSEIMSDLNEDYYEFWWEDEVPELDNFFQACTINMRGFAMSPDGRYLYMGTLNGGTGVRGVVVYDTTDCRITDLYYHYDGEAGLSGSPFSYAKGIAADDRGYVYTGFAFSRNYNVVNLGIAQQQEDGTLEELAFIPAYQYGDPGDEGGTKVGVNGVDVAKIGDKYYCYVMVNYDHDALYCFDVTDPAKPVLNTEFGVDGCIPFSQPSNTVAAEGFTLKEGQYLDVDDDGTIWLAVNSNEGSDGIMMISADGKACGGVIPMNGVYSVERADSYLLCGMKDGTAVVVLDANTRETVATVTPSPDFGDRITRMQVVNGVLFVCDAGNDDNMFNAIQAAPLTEEGQVFFDSLVENLAKATSEEDTEAPTDEPTEAPTVNVDTEAPTDGLTEAPTVNVDTEAPSADQGCASVAGFGAVAALALVAAAVALKKKD